jgi:hypothetical protein
VPYATWNALPECDEHPQLHAHARQGRLELAEVDLSLRARGVDLRDEHVLADQIPLDPAAGDVPRHRHLLHRCLVLSDQPLPHPPGSVPLLPRHVLLTSVISLVRE